MFVFTFALLDTNGLIDFRIFFGDSFLTLISLFLDLSAKLSETGFTLDILYLYLVCFYSIMTV